jgi:hypothetical protein
MLLILTLAPIAFALQEVPAPDEPAPKVEKKICRATGTTGSRFRRAPVCKTRTEWDAQEEASRKRLDDFRGNARSDPTP